METKEKEIITFFNKLTSSINKSGVKTNIPDIFDDLINDKECYYIFDLTLGKIVFHKGFEKVFGYPENEVSYDFLLRNYHPEDIETILRISKASISHCLSKPFECQDSLLQITYRFKTIDNTYIKILSQSSAFEINKEGYMTSILVKLTDISFLENTKYVNWNFNASNLNKEAFKKQVYSAYKDFFTKREVEIIKEISQGRSTRIIAKKLNISKHTVSTHRKNILKKANRHSIEDLILFCKRKGIL